MATYRSYSFCIVYVKVIAAKKLPIGSKLHPAEQIGKVHLERLADAVGGVEVDCLLA
jgi:hypothetical protein